MNLARARTGDFATCFLLAVLPLTLAAAPASAGPPVDLAWGGHRTLDPAPQRIEARQLRAGGSPGVRVVSAELGGAVILVESVADSGDAPAPADNDFTRIEDGLAAAAVLGAGTVVRLEGFFDWTEANAAASWAAAGFGLLAPIGIADITLTAESLGAATIQGPGDDPTAGLDGFFVAFGGTYQGWTVSNLVIRDFSLALGFFFDQGGAGTTEDFNGLTVTNNLIEMPPDVLDDGGNFQNIAIHLGFGEDQTISGNEITTPGDGDSTAGTLASVGLQSNTSSTDAYDGLMIVDNLMRVLGTQMPVPEFVIGFWENSGDSASEVTITGNSFLNEGAGNDPTLNRQQAFRVHSQATVASGKTTTYANNLVVGAEFGITWLEFSMPINYNADSDFVEVTGNTLLDTETAFRVRSDDGNARGRLRYNRVHEAVTGLRVDGGEADAENNWWGCNGGLETPPPEDLLGSACPVSDLVTGTLDADPWLTFSSDALPKVVEINTPAAVLGSVRVNSDGVDLGPIAFPPTEVAFITDFGGVSSPQTTVDGLATSTFLSAQSGVAHTEALLDEAAAPSRILVTDGGAVTVRSVGETMDPPSPKDNDYTRLNDVIQAIGDGVAVVLEGTFDWTEANAAASWALGSDGAMDTGDDYAIVPPPGFSDVTVTADILGDGVLQGPGDLLEQGFEGVFALFGGTYQGWTFQNLDFRGFDWTLGMFCCAGPGGTTQFQGVSVLDNRFEMPTDLAPAMVGDPEAFQNVAVHFAFGNDQTISGNEFLIPGDGVSNTGEGRFAATVAMQSNTSGGTAYDGLLIDGNVVRVLNAQSADPETVIGYWENGHAHASDVTVSNNSFLNEAAGNDPALNKQKGFRMTSHSSATTTVLYSGNRVAGANLCMTWLEFGSGVSYPAAVEPIQVIGNDLEDCDIAVRVRSDDGNARGNLAFNRLADSRLGVQSLNSETVAENNWWGCNAGPDQPGCSGTEVISEEDLPDNPGTFFPSSLDADPWLVLTVTVTDDELDSGETTPVTASLTINSDAADTSGLGTVPDGIPATFATAGGSFAPMVAPTAGGVATSTLTAGVIGGPFLAEATVDAETRSDGYTVNNAPVADLEVAITPARTLLDDGEMGTLTVTFANAGPDAVTGASISADFPGELAAVTWTCSGSGTAVCETPGGSGDVDQTVDLLAGEAITIVAEATAPTPFRGILGVGASASSPLADPDPADDNAAAELRSRVLFSDGFESGDISAWSGSLGGP